MCAAGPAAAALYTFRQPGIYAYLNHDLIEAVLLGATAHFKVEGQWNNDLMTQVKKPGPIVGQGRTKRLMRQRWAAATEPVCWALNIKTAIVVAAFAAGPVAASFWANGGRRRRHRGAAMVEIAPGTMQYWAPGEFDRDGKPVNAPRLTVSCAVPSPS